MGVGEITILVLTGVVVGVINTFAGAGATISITVYSLLGLPLPIANATNRISVVFQTITMSAEFYRQKMLDWRLGLRLAMPTVVGSILGSWLIVYVSSKLFGILLCCVLILLIVLLIYDPTKALKGRIVHSEPRWYHYITLVIIGFYGGVFHIGVGYLFLALFIGGLGYDLMGANALKGFVVLIYTLFAVLVFALNHQIDWTHGLIHSVGNIIGAYFATRYARFIPLKVLRYALLLFITLTIIYIIFGKIL